MITVSQLKKHVGPNARVVATFPPMDPHHQLLMVPLKFWILALLTGTILLSGPWLIEWAYTPREEATWEFADDMMQQFLI